MNDREITLINDPSTIDMIYEKNKSTLTIMQSITLIQTEIRL